MMFVSICCTVKFIETVTHSVNLQIIILHKLVNNHNYDCSFIRKQTDIYIHVFVCICTITMQPSQQNVNSQANC